MKHGLTAANPHDAILFAALLDDLPVITTPSGQRRSTPGKVHADKAYDHNRRRAHLRGRGFKVRIARLLADSLLGPGQEPEIGFPEDG